MQLHALLPGQHLGKGGAHISTQTGAGSIQFSLHQLAAMLGRLHASGALAADFYGLVPLQRHGAGFAPRVFLRIGQFRVGPRPALNDRAFAGSHGLRGGAQTGVVLHGQSQCGLQAHGGRRGSNGWRRGSGLLRPATGRQHAQPAAQQHCGCLGNECHGDAPSASPPSRWQTFAG